MFFNIIICVKTKAPILRESGCSAYLIKKEFLKSVC